MYRVILMLVGAAFIGLVLVLVDLNGHSVTVAFPMFEVQAQLNTVLVFCFVCGAAVSLFPAGWLVLNCRRRVRELGDKAAVAEQEVFHLRRNVIQD